MSVNAVDADDSRVEWLMVTISTGGESSTLRVHAWRKLRSLGAHYLHNGVAIVPNLRDTARAINRLVDRVNREGGQASSWTIQLAVVSQERVLIDRLNAERSDEYNEFCSRVPAFLDEIAHERALGRTTYAEVEESEADLDRLRTWIKRINDRDYFDAPGGSEAAEALARCVEEFELFESESLQADVPVQPEIAVATDPRALRIVEDGK